MLKKEQGPVRGAFGNIWKGRIFAQEDKRYVVRSRRFQEDEVRVGMEEIRKLRDTYGISTPKFAQSRREFENTTTSGQRSFVAQYVEGFNLYDTFLPSDYDPVAFQEDADNVCSGLAKYFLDIYRNGGIYLYDIHFRQFMYGSVNGGPKKIILVDIDPYTRRLKNENKHDELGQDFFREGPEEVASIICLIESNFPGVKLERSKQEAKKFISMLPDGSWIKKNAWYVMPLVNVLVNEESL